MNKEQLQAIIASDERAIAQRLAWMSQTQDEEIMQHHRATLEMLRRFKAGAERQLKGKERK